MKYFTFLYHFIFTISLKNRYLYYLQLWMGKLSHREIFAKDHRANKWWIRDFNWGLSHSEPYDPNY